MRSVLSTCSVAVVTDAVCADAACMLTCVVGVESLHFMLKVLNCLALIKRYSNVLKFEAFNTLEKLTLKALWSLFS